MKITVLGAAGSRVVAEALSRGHEVTAVERNSAHSNGFPTGVKILTDDAGNVEDVAKISAGQDVVVSAIRPSPGNKYTSPDTQNKLIGERS